MKLFAALNRLLRIFFVVIRYRLDDIVYALPLPWYLRATRYVLDRPHRPGGGCANRRGSRRRVKQSDGAKGMTDEALRIVGAGALAREAAWAAELMGLKPACFLVEARRGGSDRGAVPVRDDAASWAVRDAGSGCPSMTRRVAMRVPIWTVTRNWTPPTLE